MKPIRGGLLSVVGAAALLLLLTAAALAVTGDLTQPAGALGCISDDGSGPCANGHALKGPSGVVVSPDGKNVYVTSHSNDAVVRFNRNTATGAISQPAGAAGCVSETGAGLCADGHALNGAGSVAVSPDGKSLYVASGGTGGSDALARFNRNTATGAISQPAGSAGCISETGSGPCADGHGLDSPQGVAVSPEGNNIYVVSAFSNAVVRVNRNTATGAISQPPGSAGCISEDGAGPCADGRALNNPIGVEVSQDGKSVYVGSYFSDAVARLNRDSATGAISQPVGAAGCISETGAGGCTDGHGLDGPWDLAVSPDGKSVYVASTVDSAARPSDALARINRNTTTGAIAQPAGTLGCISEDGAGPCADGHGLNGPVGVAVSPDGKSVYVSSQVSHALARINRNTINGAITQPPGPGGCVSQSGAGTCVNGHALRRPLDVAVSMDGKSVYMASLFSKAVARFNRAP